MMTALNRALIVPRVQGEGIGVERCAPLLPPCPDRNLLEGCIAV